jgi:hypothetical protein
LGVILPHLEQIGSRLSVLEDRSDSKERTISQLIPRVEQLEESEAQLEH